ncbi:hypothetical protein MHH56_04965 [Paenibacillus sp. FSL K6-3182]|uniref:hypothetical protein n=1 Tax=Paenibacillus sp. FSL K6-3182 TaxID=2921495 RepID=UPI0030CD36EC
MVDVLHQFYINSKFMVSSMAAMEWLSAAAGLNPLKPYLDWFFAVCFLIYSDGVGWIGDEVRPQSIPIIRPHLPVLL